MRGLGFGMKPRPGAVLRRSPFAVLVVVLWLTAACGGETLTEGTGESENTTVSIEVEKTTTVPTTDHRGNHDSSETTTTTTPAETTTTTTAETTTTTTAETTTTTPAETSTTSSSSSGNWFCRTVKS